MLMYIFVVLIRAQKIRLNIFVLLQYARLNGQTYINRHNLQVRLKKKRELLVLHYKLFHTRSFSFLRDINKGMMIVSLTVK